jgi:TetR/AcrR family transcriptional repressor of nem operon
MDVEEHLIARLRTTSKKIKDVGKIVWFLPDAGSASTPERIMDTIQKEGGIQEPCRLGGGRMRKSRAEAAETRRRIVRAAAAEFCEKGIHAAGLAELMAAAGLTHGGFYKHFASKDQLVAEACATGLQSFVAEEEEVAERGRNGLVAIVESYLSTKHRDRLSKSCPLAGLGSEIARADEGTRAAVTEGLMNFAEVMAREYRGTKPEVAKAEALVAISTMVGALTLARIVTDPKISDLILRSARKSLTK